MGDRGNILVKQYGPKNEGPEYVYLYTHWSGHELPGILQDALKKKWRWTDESYLARIIFQEMLGDDEGETGYGISARCMDNEHPFLIVDCQEQTVALTEKRKPEQILKRWTFEDYTKLDIEKEFGDF